MGVDGAETAHLGLAAGGGDAARDVVPGVHMQAHTQDPPLQPLIDGGDQGAQFRAGVVAGGQPRPGLRTPACEVAT